MKELLAGQFHGKTYNTLSLTDKVLTDTEYTHPRVDWHYHEHAYFTFILAGRMVEGNCKEVYYCEAGTLLFHHWQDPHYNTKPPGFTRGFHVELNTNWFRTMGLNKDAFNGSFKIQHPQIKLIMYDILKETKNMDISSERGIDSCLIKVFAALSNVKQVDTLQKPGWVHQLKEILADQSSDTLSLGQLAEMVGIHPVHLSRDFHKYFLCNLGVYHKKRKIEHALALMTNRKKSLVEIAYECGYADQSHFIRSFKQEKGMSPKSYRHGL